MKNILILCTQNSARTIMAETLIKFNFKSEVNCYSAGLKNSEKIDENTLKAIKEFGISTKDLETKTLNTLDNIDFDIVVIVCDEGENIIPEQYSDKKIIFIDIEDPKGKKFFEYLKTMNNINTTLIPQLKELLK